MKNILIVDDDRVNLIVAKRILAKEYNPITVSSGAEALQYVKENPVDLILLDLQMPEMDGFQVMEQLQSDEKWKKIPVIFLTADKSEETESKCFEMGADDYINKPFMPVIMQHRVHRSIELQDLRARVYEREEM